jgi:hypothetical protein
MKSLIERLCVRQKRRRGSNEHEQREPEVKVVERTNEARAQRGSATASPKRNILRRVTKQCDVAILTWYCLSRMSGISPLRKGSLPAHATHTNQRSSTTHEQAARSAARTVDGELEVAQSAAHRVGRVRERRACELKKNNKEQSVRGEREALMEHEEGGRYL